MGALPPNPLENKKIHIPPRCPRSANSGEGRKKGKKEKRKKWGLFAPKPPGKIKRFISLPAVRVPRTTGRERKKVSYGGFAPKPPGKIKRFKSLPAVRVPRTTRRAGKKEAMGALPPNPLENKKRFKPLLVVRVPRTTRRERKKEAMGALPPSPLENKKIHIPPRCPRSANSGEGRKKGKKEKRKEWGLFAPKPLTRNNVPGPLQLVHRILDTTQAGAHLLYFTWSQWARRGNLAWPIAPGPT